MSHATFFGIAFEMKLYKKVSLQRMFTGKSWGRFSLIAQFSIRVLVEVVETHNLSNTVFPEFSEFGSMCYN
jgi:hypothetical protein